MSTGKWFNPQLKMALIIISCIIAVFGVWGGVMADEENVWIWVVSIPGSIGLLILLAWLMRNNP